MIFDFRGKDTCADPKAIDLLVKSLSAVEILPLARRWFEDTIGAAPLERMDYIRAANIAMSGDKLHFDATFDCRLTDGRIMRLTFRAMMVCGESALRFRHVETYIGDAKRADSALCRCDDNLVPIIGNSDLEAEAAAFLQEYCPEALLKPQAVPIEQILKNGLGLAVLRDVRAVGDEQDDGEQPFGQIFFTETPIEYRSLRTGEIVRGTASRGTILVDGARTAGSEGCVNNTLAHEGLHWRLHRIYAAVRNHLHQGQPFIACRKSARRRRTDKPRTDEDWLEWQANSIAPRILMPQEPFKTKAREFMERRGDSDGSAAVPEAIIRDLAEFFKVSRQSAGIRLIEVGLKREAADERGRTAALNQTTAISESEAFREYCENTDFRALVDSGAVLYVENRFVLNDQRYIAEFAGRRTLTAYARQRRRACCVVFTRRKVYPKAGLGWRIACRYDKSALKSKIVFEAANNTSILADAAEFQRLEVQFDAEYAEYLSFIPTFADIAVALMKKRQWTSTEFKERTHLDDTAYSHITKGSRAISLRNAVAFCVGIGANKTIADKLLAAAGYVLTRTKEHFAYNFLLTTMRGRSIDDCNTFLEGLGFEPLGCRDYMAKRAANRNQSAVTGAE